MTLYLPIRFNMLAEQCIMLLIYLTLSLYECMNGIVKWFRWMWIWCMWCRKWWGKIPLWHLWLWWRISLIFPTKVRMIPPSWIISLKVGWIWPIIITNGPTIFFIYSYHTRQDWATLGRMPNVMANFAFFMNLTLITCLLPTTPFNFKASISLIKVTIWAFKLSSSFNW